MQRASRSTRCPARWRGRLLVIAAFLAATAVSAYGLYQNGGAWPANGQGVTLIPTCFRAPGTVVMIDGEPKTIYPSQADWEEKKAIVLDSLADSWQRWAAIVFIDHGECPSDLSGFLYIDLIPEDCGGCGRSGVGFHPDGVGLYLLMENADLRLLRSVAMHEVPRPSAPARGPSGFRRTGPTPSPGPRTSRARRPRIDGS